MRISIVCDDTGLVAVRGLVVGFQAVPGLGAKTGLLWLCFATIAAGFMVAPLLASPVRLTFERVVTVGVVFVIGMIGLTRLPTLLRNRNAEYTADASVSYRHADQITEASVGMDPHFLAFLDRWIPRGESFTVVTGPTVHTAGPQAWAQYVLMPRVENYFSPCAAQWVVFVHSPSRLAGVTLGPPFLKYKPGFAVAKNAGRCT